MKSILITSSILIVLVAALRPLLRGRIDPRMQYALWLIVALRLLVPVELASSAYSALALLERAEEPARVVEAIGQAALPAQSYDSAYAQVIEQYRKQGTDTAQLTPRDLMDIDTQARELMRGPTLAELAAKCARPVWLGGTALMAAWFLLVNLRLRRKLGRAELIEIEESCGLPVFVSGALPSPCLCGVFRPAVFVTPAAAEDPDRMRHVLAHETTHYRHRDHWWALVRCLCLYWFNPLVWWAAAMSRQDCELACDAGAIRRLGEAERLPYGRTLVAMIAAGRNSLLQTATTMTGSKRRVRERVKLIARKPKTVLALALALVLVLGLTVGFTFTGAPEKDPVPTGLSADSLRERLMDVPEELKPTVTASASETKAGINDIALVSYWWDVPAEWESEQSSWLLDVHRWERSLIDGRGWPQISDEPTQIIAQDEEFYYVLEWPGNPRFQMADSEPFTAAYQAIRAFAEQQVLRTEGLEPYVSPLDTLQARLMDVPEEWRDTVSASPAMGGEVSCLASYWLSDPKWQDLWSGWLLNLYRMDEAGIQERLDQQLWPAVDIFARSGDEYYAILWADDGRYQDGELGEEYWAAVNAMKDHAKAAVLATAGVEPFDPYTTPPHFFSNVPQPPLEPGRYAIDGMDYTLVTSYEQVPEDPEQWYLVGQMNGYPVWMFTRNHGNETMFQVEDRLTQVFSYQSGFFSAMSTSGHAPQLMPLEGFGWGPKGTFGPFAVITHLFQGGTDQQYQLTVYDLGTDPAATAAYVHDWEPLMEDFNANVEAVVHDDTHSVTITYQGASAEIRFDDINDDRSVTLTHWDNVQQNGFTPETYEYCMNYFFNDDGTFNLAMPVNPFTTDCIAVWTLRFTGSGFENVGFRFDQTDDAYTYISTIH